MFPANPFFGGGGKTKKLYGLLELIKCDCFMIIFKNLRAIFILIMLSICKLLGTNDLLGLHIQEHGGGNGIIGTSFLFDGTIHGQTSYRSDKSNFGEILEDTASEELTTKLHMLAKQVIKNTTPVTTSKIGPKITIWIHLDTSNYYVYSICKCEEFNNIYLQELRCLLVRNQNIAWQLKNDSWILNCENDVEVKENKEVIKDSIYCCDWEQKIQKQQPQEEERKLHQKEILDKELKISQRKMQQLEE